MSSADSLKSKTGRHAAIIIVLGLAMAAFAIAMAFNVRVMISTAFEQLARTRDAQLGVASALSNVVDAETGYRGFLLTRDADFLSPYESSSVAAPVAIANLRKLASEEEDLRDDIMRFSQAANSLMDTMVEQVSQWKENKSDPRTGIGRISAIKSDVDALRAMAANLQLRLTAQLSDRRQGVSFATSRLLFTVSILILGLGLIVFAQARNLVLQTAHHDQRHDQSSRAIAGLTDTVSRAEAELAASHRQLELALRSAKVQVFTLRSDGVVEWVSDGKSALARMRTAPFSLADLAEEKDRATVSDRIEKSFVSGEPTEFELRLSSGDGRREWVKTTLDPSAGGEAALGVAVDITGLREREERMFWLMRELSHRSKNLLAIVQAIARQTARSVNSIEAFETRFQARMRGLAAAHDLLVKSSYEGADLAEIIASQLGALDHFVGSRIFLHGPSVFIRHEAAQNIAMAFQELFSNAEAHGALSTGKGRVAIDWRIADEASGSRLLIDWVESEGPPPDMASSKGFGTSIIAVNLPRSLDGDVTLERRADGVVCHMALPMRRLQPDAAAGRA